MKLCIIKNVKFVQTSMVSYKLRLKKVQRLIFLKSTLLNGRSCGGKVG